VDHLDTAQFYGAGFVNEVIRAAVRVTDDDVVVSKVGGDADPHGPHPVRLAQLAAGEITATELAGLEP
jgi:pyridoxine 4-dehydrogenase